MRKRPPFAATGLDRSRLQAWIEAGWICPGPASSERLQLSDIDLARAQLICDLQDDLGVNDEGVEVILDLLDQLYGLRQAVRDMLDGMMAEAKK
jgi:chaperone modulatory protein CbpM